MTAGWSITSVSTPEIVGLTTAFLVAYSTWRQAKMAKVVKDVHTLTNSAMGKQLLDKVDLLKAMAVLAHSAAEAGNGSALAAAQAIDKRVEAAVQEYTQHQLNQAKVDAGS
jgi:hypothetical protein